MFYLIAFIFFIYYTAKADFLREKESVQEQDKYRLYQVFSVLLMLCLVDLNIALASALLFWATFEGISNKLKGLDIWQVKDGYLKDKPIQNKVYKIAALILSLILL